MSPWPTWSACSRPPGRRRSSQLTAAVSRGVGRPLPLVLGIETSCDETAAAVLEHGTVVRSSVVASQAELHASYGGVFPEMASRQHVRDIGPVVHRALEAGDVGLEAVSAVAATCGPGLSGSLLVGINFAKGLAMAAGKPLIGVNHLAGHLYSNWLHDDGVLRTDAPARAPADLPRFPYLTLIVSGGHTELVLVRGHGDAEVLGATRDDAAGEAFDKVARLLGLGYPGGPEIEALARTGDPTAFDLPVADLEDPLEFSFSGLKTAVLRLTQQPGVGPGAADGSIDALSAQSKADIAAAFQSAVVRALVQGLRRALEQHDAAEVHLAGGVSANRALRDAVREAVDRPVRIPPVALCTDNAAMIACAAAWLAGPADNLESGLGLDAQASLAL